MLDRGDQGKGERDELRNDLEEMLFDGVDVGKSTFFAGNRDPGASGNRGTGLQYQSYGERGGWTEYEYPDDEFVSVSGEDENYILEKGGDLTTKSESDELNEVEFGDLADRRISVDGERKGTYSSYEDLRTTTGPNTYKTTIKYKTTVNDSFNYIRLENDPKATATTATTKTTVTTTTTTTYSTSGSTVRYIENGQGVHWPRVPTSSFIDYPEYENEIPEGTTPRATAAEEREGTDDEENIIIQHDISPKSTSSSATSAPGVVSTSSTVNFLVPEIRVTYVPPDKREVDTTTEKVLAGGVLFGGGSGGGAAENAAGRFPHLSSVMLIPLVLIFLYVEFVLHRYLVY